MGLEKIVWLSSTVTVALRAVEPRKRFAFPGGSVIILVVWLGLLNLNAPGWVAAGLCHCNTVSTGHGHTIQVFPFPSRNE